MGSNSRHIRCATAASDTLRIFAPSRDTLSNVLPVIVGVATDESLRAALSEVLTNRYGSDYDVRIIDSPQQGLDVLRELDASVALMLAAWPMSDCDGIEFLIAAHAIHPEARRIVVIDVGDTSAAGPLSRALTLNQVDAYFGQPWASPEEELHPLLADELRLWARANQPRYAKTIIIDAPDGTRGHQLRGWLERNSVATTLLTPDDESARALLTERAVPVTQLPITVLYDGRVLVDPSDTELVEALGARTRPTGGRYDVAIVGAGPAGLATALYAGSEGLRALVVEGDSVGGQAGTSANIRNYLGFPWGLSGGELTSRAARQAEQLGAEFIITPNAESVRADGDVRMLTLSNGDVVEARTVVLAGGVTYRRLGVPAVDSLVGAGVFYGAAPSEAAGMHGLDVSVLGAGNSAAQAAAHLAAAGARVTMLVRGASLTTSMSDYLVREIEAAPNITVRLRNEVVDAGTNGCLDHLVVRDANDGSTTELPAQALFVFIGARPHTDWLTDAVALDDRGFALTGRDLEGVWSLDRPPAWLETSMPGVFAAGDIRFGSVKRVAAAVGEGSTAAMLVREYLAPG
jgi:thioredoxin reductase (NADPH)